MSHLDTTLAPNGSAHEAEHEFAFAPVDRIRILVADPDPLARRALTDALRAAGGYLVIGQAGDGVEAVELALHYTPDAVLLATHLPRADATEVCARIVSARPTTRVVMLATSPDVEFEMRAVRAGASGFLVKTDEIDSIARARCESSAKGTRSSRPS